MTIIVSLVNAVLPFLHFVHTKNLFLFLQTQALVMMKSSPISAKWQYDSQISNLI